MDICSCVCRCDDLGCCSQFLFQRSVVFSQRPSIYPTVAAKRFREMRIVFDHPVKGRAAAGQLLSLRKVDQSVLQFAITLHILMAEADWDQKALLGGITGGLSKMNELATGDETQSLDELIDLAMRLDNRLRQRHTMKTGHRRSCISPSASPLPSDSPQPSIPDQPTSMASPVSPGVEEPMQLGQSRLIPQERRRRINQHPCIYCGEGEHFLTHCPELPKGRSHQFNQGALVSQTTTSSDTDNQILLRGMLWWGRNSLPVHAFVDSGADRNFIRPGTGYADVHPHHARDVLAINSKYLVKVNHSIAPLIV